ncbi:Acetyltransferase (GNAT) family protein [Poseidonocella pacifica]|uniref:Acetyltransferase (GNAT) family protein n=1 Tax=Poseidonocella pacifica TaxID=871651 RepID=A0A1I0VK11_9RHOB|nr:GNAT family N-acetyltransferase [Poseidonocella pacifica]SFA75896.1 Acetyltransferase (GNAT) family protein [Poseidonocella pacifica]
MSRLLHLAGAEDRDRLLPLVAAFHAEIGQANDPAEQAEAVDPLLEGSPHGAIWLIGPRRAPVGYVSISFGWSVAAGGLDGRVDALFIREKVRGRGMATEALNALAMALRENGIKALNLDVEAENEIAFKLYRRCGFRKRESSIHMARTLR